jgi:hypothetical protein
MAIEHRQKYLIRIFNGMHDKLTEAFEEVSDGEFDQCKNTINSLIYDLKDVKKRMQP